MEKERNDEIDGLRGWAATGVLFFHFFQETFGRLHPFLHHEVFFVLLNGPMMVQIFFILSGDALSAGYFSHGLDKRTVRIIVARYFRLTFPILVTCLLTFLSLTFGIVYNHQAAVVVDRTDWLGSFLSFRPTLEGLVSYTFAGVYGLVPNSESYNNFLWTMSLEMLGSVLVFVNILVLNYLRKETVMWLLIIEFFFFYLTQSPLSFFVLGVLFGHLRQEGLWGKLRKARGNSVLLWVFLGMCMIILPFYRNQFPWLVGKLTLGLVEDQYTRYFFPVVLVVLIYSSRHLVSFFSTRVSRFLGEVSFPIYVFQFNVLVTYTSWSLLGLEKLNALSPSLWLVIPVSSLLLTFALATLFRPVERCYLSHLNDFITRKILKSNP